MTESKRDLDLIIATPFYNFEGYAPYIRALTASMQACWQSGVKVEYWQICGDSYIWRARNEFCRKFLDETDAEWLLFIDSDHSWNLMGFVRLITAAGEVVGCVYPTKNNWKHWSAEILIDQEEYPLVNPQTGLIQADKMPTGMMKISRGALEKVRANEPDNSYLDERKNTVHGFFNQIMEGQKAYGEDISFCLRCKRAGVNMWIQPNITISHYGIDAHTGNFDEFLRQPGINPDVSIQQLKNKHQGETAYIVGKGPSLSKLESCHFGSGPVITMNQSVLKVESLWLDNPIYSLQKDGGGDEVLPYAATLIVHEDESIDIFPDYAPRLIFSNRSDFKMPWNAPSIMSATQIANLMGCKEIVYLCCDAHTTRDLRTATPQENGEIKITNNPGIYRGFEKWLPKLLDYLNLSAEWVTPGDNPDLTPELARKMTDYVPPAFLDLPEIKGV